MLLTKKIHKDTIVVPLKGTTRSTIIQELLNQLVDFKYLTTSIKLFSFIEAMESEFCSTTGRGVAFPHSISKEVDELICILGISSDGILYNEDDVHPCHIILLSLSPINKSDIHRKFIARFRLLLSNPNLKNKIIDSTSPIALETIIKNWENIQTEEQL